MSAVPGQCPDCSGGHDVSPTMLSSLPARTSDDQLDPTCPSFAFLSAVGASASCQNPDSSQHIY